MATELPPLPKPPKVLTGLGCASCGGTVEVHEGWTTVTCKYCDTPLAVLGERGVTRVMVLNELDQATASNRVRKWLRSGIRKDPALRRESRFDEAFLAWFPFVRTRFDLVGWVLGATKKKVKRGDRWETVDVAMEREVEKSVDRTAPSADMAEFGVHRVDLARDEVVPLNESQLRGRGMVFRPTLSPAEAADKLIEAAIKDVQQSSRLDRVTFSWFASMRRNITLVYYPLWIFRYSFRGRTYQVLIDAEDGSLAYGKAPGNHLYRAASLVAACAGACFIGTSVLQNLGFLFRSENGLAALGFIGVVMAGLVSWGYSRFRHGGVVEEGTGLAKGLEPKGVVDSVKKIMDQFE